MLKLPFLPLKLTRTAVKVVGLKNTFFLLLGVVIGLLIAPTTGAELRAKLADQLAGGGLATGTVPVDDRDLSM
ncbi:MAG: hypothetical protein JWM05_2229 [Acidimicrobiales bacterium]|nr:hypothetical protein [Acidimicrobiales bacterium]